MPRGLCWFRQSCAYDAFITPIYNIWAESRERWAEVFDTLNADYLGALAENFSRYEATEGGLEKCRWILQRHLVHDWPSEFTMYEETCLYSLLSKLLTLSSVVASSFLFCEAGHAHNQNVAPSNSCLFNISSLDNYHTVQEFVHKLETEASSVCHDCGVRHIRKSTFVHLLPLLAFDVSHHTEILIDQRLVVTSSDEVTARYRLRGVIYFAHHHFTSQFVSPHGIV